MNSATYVASLLCLPVDATSVVIKACFISIIFSCSHQSVFLEGVLSNVCHTSFSVPILCSKLLPFRFARLRFLAIGPASMRRTSFFCCLRSLLFYLSNVSFRIMLACFVFYAFIVIQRCLTFTSDAGVLRTQKSAQLAFGNNGAVDHKNFSPLLQQAFNLTFRFRCDQQTPNWIKTSLCCSQIWRIIKRNKWAF